MSVTERSLLMTTALSFFAIAIAIAPVAAGAAVDPAAKCIDAKAKSAGQAAQKKLTCHSKAAAKGEAVDAACLTKAGDGMATKFSKAEAKGGCLTTADTTLVAAMVDAVVSTTLEALLPSGPTGTKCSSKKLKSAGKRASKGLKAHGKAVKKASGDKLGADLSKAAQGFSKDFTKAEGQGDCQTSGDAVTAGATVDASYDAIVGALAVVASEDATVASGAEPAETPGTAGVDANAYPNLVTQFGGSGFSLNNASYTRFYYQPDGVTPDAIVVLVPGFEGGALSFKILAENLVGRAFEQGTRLEVWAYDRRGHQIEDLAGQDIAEATFDAQLLLDWYFGSELGLPLSPELSRRAFFHDEHADTAFIANWTSLVFSRDIDAIIEEARTKAANQNVFLGGHSAGTGFTARYASTNLNLTGIGPADPGYAKVRGLVLLEGGGGSSSGATLTSDELDLIEDKADGGLFFAVRDDAPRCVDGTACATNGDCAGKGKGKCVEPTAAYSLVPGLLNPRVLAAGEVSAIQAMTDPDTGMNLIIVDQAGADTSAVDLVPDLASLAILGTGTAYGGIGSFLDDDGIISAFATFVRTSVGAPGPVVGGLQTWQDIAEGPMPPSVLVDNGPVPTSLPAGEWGVEVEVTRMDRMMPTFFAGGGNFTDWYYPSSGLSTTSGLSSMDTSQLSVGRARPDIANATEAANIDVPVICLGTSNGLTSVPGDFVGFGQSLGVCTAPSCDGVTARVVDAGVPNDAFPTLGDIAGGFEAHITEGSAHVDVTTAEDDSRNNVIGPLLAFIERNAQ